MTPHYSIIVPIFNRPDEAKELLESLSLQTEKDFELVLVEDGSLQDCADTVAIYQEKIAINYIKKINTGRSDTRNVGMTNAKGAYFVFFDSDCIIPPDYFEKLTIRLHTDYADCFGGPDSAHESFSDWQKAINYAMTSFWTTGGIRGGKIQMEKFVPRTFNMGFSRSVYKDVGGYNSAIDYGEDMDISTRIRLAKFSIKLYQDVFVYHKRRVNLTKFYQQVYNFGYSRIATIYKLYPDTLKLVHFLPSVFVIGCCLIVSLAICCSWYFSLFLIFYFCLLFFDALWQSHKLAIACRAVPASFVQLFGYGIGFLKASFNYLFGNRN